jgi:GDP-L-fucose synthase
MQPGSKIFVAGHRGLVGSALMRTLRAKGFSNIINRTHADLDLTDAAPTHAFFQREKPEYVFDAAAKVGGIVANDSYPAEFIHQNLAIQTNVIHESWRAGVKRLLFLGSSCIYPRDCPQPIKEGYLLTGPLEPTNRAYAIAKIAGVEMCWTYNRQHGTKYIAATPTNLYGKGDNYDLKTSHVLPALIRKFHEAKEAGRPEVEIWGTGKPLREFLYSDDAADACVFLMNLPDDKFNAMCADVKQPPLVNIGCGEDQTIKAMAEMVSAVVGFQGRLRFDTSKPDGTPKKQLDVSRLAELGWRPKISLDKGLKLAYQQFLAKLS